AKERFSFGECGFDRIDVGTVGREETEVRARRSASQRPQDPFANAVQHRGRRRPGVSARVARVTRSRSEMTRVASRQTLVGPESLSASWLLANSCSLTCGN